MCIVLLIEAEVVMKHKFELSKIGMQSGVVFITSIVLIMLLQFPPKFVVQLNEIYWLPFIIGVVSVGFSFQYGKTRLAYIGLMILLYQVLPLLKPVIKFTVFYRELLPAIIVSTCAYLSATGDRNMTINTVLRLIGSIILIAAGIIALSIFADPQATSSSFAGDISVMPSALVSFMVALGIVMYRLIVAPSNTTMSIAITVGVLSITILLMGQVISNFYYTVLPIIYFISVVKDSHAMAFKDELTGITSRRALMKDATGLGRVYTVVMGDVDHFKSFNDTHGHDVGDQVLRLVASKLRQVTGGGRAYRYGGEEFTLLFPNKTPEQAKEHVEAVRRAIEEYVIKLRSEDRKNSDETHRGAGGEKNTTKVTMSFGVAEPSTEDEKFEKVIKRADNALYAAKGAGRNCVILAGEST